MTGVQTCALPIYSIIDFASIAVMAFGAAIAFSGVLAIGEGKSQQNAAKQEEGMTKIVGGAIIIVAGLALVPQIGEFITSSTTAK